MRPSARHARRTWVVLALALALLAQPAVASAHSARPAEDTLQTGSGGWDQVTPLPVLGGLTAVGVAAGEVREGRVPAVGLLGSPSRSFVVQVAVDAGAAGTVALGEPSQAAPETPQISFSAGSTSATTLVRTDARGRLTIRSSVAARLSVHVIGVVAGASSQVGAGGTVVTGPTTLVDPVSGQGGQVPAPGATSTVPVAGLAGVPVGARAVWLSVQGRSAGSSVSFAGPDGQVAAVPGVSLAPTWSSTLVPVPVDDDGAVRYAIAGAPVSDLRIAVVGWVADPASSLGVLPAGHGVVPVPTRSLTVTSPSAASAVRTVRVAGPDLPTAVSGALVRLSVRATRSGLLTAGSSAVTGHDLTSTHLPLGRDQRTSATLVVPVGPGGTARLVLPPGSRLDEVVLLGYVGGPVSRSHDPAAPQLAVTAPVAGQVLDQAAGPEVVVTGTVADTGSGVRDVRVSVDGQAVGVAAVRAGAGAVQAWRLAVPAVAGAHVLRAVATDWSGRTTTVTRAYTVTTADADEIVIDPEVTVLTDTQQASLVSAGPDELVFAGLPPVHVGEVLVSGATQSAPEGLLRRVVAVERTGGTSVVRTLPGALTDVFVQAHVDVEDLPIEDQQPGPVVDDEATPAPAGARALPMMLRSLLAAEPSHTETLASATVSTPGKELVAKISATAKLSVTFTLDIDAHFGWGGVEPELTEFTFSVNTRGGVDLDITAKKEWEWELERQLGSVRIGASTFMVGPVPIVLTYSLDPSVYLDAKIGGKLTATYELSMSTRNGVTYTGGRWRAINERQITAAPGASAHVTASVSAGVVLDFVIKVYDLAGPYVGLKVGPAYSGDLDLMALDFTQTVSLEYGLRVGARVAVLGRTLADWNTEVAEQSYVLWTRTDAYENPEDGGTDPGDGGTDPGDGGTDPGDGGTDPGDGGTDPGDGGTDPGDVDPTGGRDVALVVDVSFPGGAELDRQRQAAHAVVDALDEGDRVAVLGYSGDAGTPLDLTGDLAAAHSAIDTYYSAPPDSARYPMLGDALDAAVRMLADQGSAGQTRAVVAFSDGGGWSSPSDPTKTLARIERITIQGVGFEPLYLGSQVAAIADATGGSYLTIAAGEDPVPALGAYVRSIGGEPSGIGATARVAEVATATTRVEEVRVDVDALPAAAASGADGARVSCTATTSPTPTVSSGGPEIAMLATYAGAGSWVLRWDGVADPMATEHRVYVCVVRALDESGAVLAVRSLRVVDDESVGLRGDWTTAAGQTPQLMLTSWPVGTTSISVSCFATYQLVDGMPASGWITGQTFSAASSTVPAPGEPWAVEVPAPNGYTYQCRIMALTPTTWRGFPEDRVLGSEAMAVDVP